MRKRLLIPCHFDWQIFLSWMLPQKSLQHSGHSFSVSSVTQAQPLSTGTAHVEPEPSLTAWELCYLPSWCCCTWMPDFLRIEWQMLKQFKILRLEKKTALWIQSSQPLGPWQILNSEMPWGCFHFFQLFKLLAVGRVLSKTSLMPLKRNANKVMRVVLKIYNKVLRL